MLGDQFGLAIGGIDLDTCRAQQFHRDLTVDFIVVGQQHPGTGVALAQPGLGLFL